MLFRTPSGVELTTWTRKCRQKVVSCSVLVVRIFGGWLTYLAIMERFRLPLPLPQYCSAHSPLGLFSDRLHHVLRSCYLPILDYLSLQQLRYYFPNRVYPSPPCQLSLWEETGATGENPQLSAER
jgi:hypothetical protein